MARQDDENEDERLHGSKDNPSEKIDNIFNQLMDFNYGPESDEERNRSDRDGPEPAGRGDERGSTGDEPREGEPGPEHEGPEPESSGDDGGGYALLGGDLPSYDDDLAMMRAEQEHIETVVIPHYELLISQAEKAGNGPRTIQALRAALEGARESKDSGDEAIDAVTSSSEAVKAAYDNAAEEAATEKDYFHGDG